MKRSDALCIFAVIPVLFYLAIERPVKEGVMEKLAEDIEVKSLAPKESIYFPDDLDCARLVIEWISKQQGIVCDLDLNLYCYDERVSVIMFCV